jgi:hypothetical protein
LDNVNQSERAFFQHTKVDVVKNSLPEDAYEKFTIGSYKQDPQKEFYIIFYTFAGIPSMKLEAVCGSLDFLYECQDLLKELASVDKGNFKPDDLNHMLIGLGIKDIANELNNI